jgi:hypothetical protein
VDLKLEPATHARLRADGVVFDTTLDLTGPPRYMKVVVYDYGADRLWSVALRIR